MMSRKMKRFILVLLLIVVASSFSNVTYARGGWPKKKGEGFFKLGQYILSSGRQFNPDGTKSDVFPRVGVYNTSFYGEYGFTDRLTGIIYLPFFSRAVLNNRADQNGDIIALGGALNSIGDTDVSLKYGLIVKGPIVVSATLTLGLPLGNPSGGPSGVLSTGDGEFNQLLTVEASHSFYPLPLYATISGGLNNRGNDFSEEWRIGAEVGYSFGDLTVLARLSSVQSFMNSDNTSNVISQGVFGNNIEYFTLSPQLIYEFNEKVGGSFGVSKAIYGSRVLADLAYDFGVSIKI